MEITFCDLQSKEVINICDGKCLGHIIDLVFDSCCAKITGIVVPGEKKFFNFFKNNMDIFIPFSRVRKIGRDVILVELNPANAPMINTLSKNDKQKALENETESIVCDVNETEIKPQREKNYTLYE